MASLTASPRASRLRGHGSAGIVWRNLAQRELSAHLKTNPSELCRYEMKDRPLRTDWLPVLHNGFPVPTALKAKTSPDVSTTSATVSVKAARKKTVQAAVGQVIDGRWLKAERNRLGA